RIQVDLRVCQLQILKEDAVQVVIIILSCMSQNTVKILPAFINHRSQTNDLRSGADDDQKLQLPVVLKCDICKISFHCHVRSFPFHSESYVKSVLFKKSTPALNIPTKPLQMLTNRCLCKSFTSFQTILTADTTLSFPYSFDMISGNPLF